MCEYHAAAACHHCMHILQSGYIGIPFFVIVVEEMYGNWYELAPFSYAMCRVVYHCLHISLFFFVLISFSRCMTLNCNPTWMVMHRQLKSGESAHLW